MAGRMERDGAVSGELLGVAEGQHVLGALARQAGAQKTRRAARAENLPMPRDMVGVRVRDERPLHPALRVEPPADLRQVDAFAILDFPGHEVRQAEGGAQKAKVNR